MIAGCQINFNNPAIALKNLEALKKFSLDEPSTQEEVKEPEQFYDSFITPENQATILREFKRLLDAKKKV
jgi:hypothetical protein